MFGMQFQLSKMNSTWPYAWRTFLRFNTISLRERHFRTILFNHLNFCLFDCIYSNYCVCESLWRNWTLSEDCMKIVEIRKHVDNFDFVHRESIIRTSQYVLKEFQLLLGFMAFHLSWDSKAIIIIIDIILADSITRVSVYICGCYCTCISWKLYGIITNYAKGKWERQLKA